MRRTFLIWLSAVICATFIITGTLVYSQFAYGSRERAKEMMATKLNDMLNLFEHAESSISYLSKANDASALDRTRALSQIINLHPFLLNNQEELQGICNLLGAEQIVVSDENGIVEAAVPESLVGYNLSAKDDIRLLTDTGDTAGYEVCSSVAPGESEHQGAMQFAGIRRLDKPGVVRLGFRTRFEQASRKESSLDSPMMKLRLGKDGSVIVFRRGIRISHGGIFIPQVELLSLPSGELCPLKVNDEDYFAYAADGGGYRLVGVLSAKEVYKASRKAVQSVLLSNLLLYAILFSVVSYLLQRIVLRGMSKVNAALRDITEGDLERRVNVTDSPEFTRLSNGINFMVESLRSVGEERQQGIKRGLELARTLQSTMLPNKFPAFPDQKRFDLYATCFQANEVGGDFYDYSMPDEDHLHFLVADVDASGIPAALYMMRAMTIIRAVARSGVEPVQIVTEVNRELCEDNQSGIRMALFYGSLNIRTGMLEYVNAGKLSSMLRRSEGEYLPLQGNTDAVLGETADSTFHTLRMQMEPQDRLFLFTEGVLHVANTSNVPYNETRLQEALRMETSSVTEVLQEVRASLRQFVEGSKIQRDITMLCMEYKGDMANKIIHSFAAGNVHEAVNMITRHMEDIFASPLDITDMQYSLSAVVDTLPQDTLLHMEFDCTEQEAELCLMYAEPELNPLELVSEPLPMDRCSYELTETKENRLILWKTLT